jgi:hypothetical protein
MHRESETKEISLSILRLAPFCTMLDRNAEKRRQSDHGVVVILI